MNRHSERTPSRTRFARWTWWAAAAALLLLTLVVWLVLQ